MHACTKSSLQSVTEYAIFILFFLYKKGMTLNSICLFLTENDCAGGLEMRSVPPNMFLENPIMQSSA